MRTYWLTCLFVLGLGGAAVPAPAAKTDRDRVQGVWVIIKAEQEGDDLTAFVKSNPSTITFDGDKYTFRLGTEVERGQFRLDPKAQIPALDYTITEGDQKGQRQLGIYRLEGDSLQVCLAKEGTATRPRAFTTRANAPEFVLFTLKRQKKE
jgi:uncharacterized protein (TIGR03067 family)